MISTETVLGFEEENLYKSKALRYFATSVSRYNEKASLRKNI